MGLEIDRETFDEADYLAFDARLRASLVALEQVMARPGFGDGPASIGAEVELDLIDELGRPCPRNRDVLARAADPRVTVEIDRFNLEINSSPVQLAGAPLTSLGAELDEILAKLELAAAGCDAHVLQIGTLPTLAAEDLQLSSLTDGRRYQVMAAGLRRMRQSAFPIRIAGRDRLELDQEDVTLEGANTSLQIHLRVAPGQFAQTFNATQIATAVALAVAGNSPLLLGRQLWDETRIALFRQAVDDRPAADPGDADEWRAARVSFGHGWVRAGAHELFAESVALHEPLLPILGPEDPIECVRRGGVPTLAELRLHQGTCWRWNRAIYDAVGGGHLRIEMRALPSGPTVVDMMANAALHVGLALALAPEIDRWLYGLTFGHARRNFYQAAQHGLEAELLWPTAAGARVRPIDARAVAERALPLARRGLVDAGVEAREADRQLAVIERRVETGQTGAVWQRRVFDDARRTVDPIEASRIVTRAYRDAAASGAAVHTWSLP